MYGFLRLLVCSAILSAFSAIYAFSQDSTDILDDKDSLSDSSSIVISKDISSTQINQIPVENPLAIPNYYNSQIFFNNSPNYGTIGLTQLLVGGVDLSSPMNGMYGFAGMEYYPVTSRYGLEEIRIYDSYVPVEYGQTLDGLIEYRLKQGSPVNYEGFIRYNTEVPQLFGSADVGKKVVKDQLTGKYKVADMRAGDKLNSTGQNSWEAGVGGPIPLLQGATFFLSTRYFTMDNEPGLEVYDPANNNLGKMPDQGRWVKNISGNISYDLNPDMNLAFETVIGLASYETSDWLWLYANDLGKSGIGENVEERIAKQNAVNQSIQNFSLRFTHHLNNDFSYEVTLSRSRVNQESDRKASFDGPSFWSGFDLIEPKDNFQFHYDTLVAGSDNYIDHYVSGSRIDTTDDGFLLIEKPLFNSLTGYIEREAGISTDNPYGFDAFLEHGNSFGFDFLKSSYWDADARVIMLLKPFDLDNHIKLGLNFRSYELKRHANLVPWYNTRRFDVFSDEVDEIAYDKPYGFDPGPAEPYIISAYAEDNISIGPLVINGGIRADFFDPERSYLPILSYYHYKYLMSSPDAKPKFIISPRLNISWMPEDFLTTTLSLGRYSSMPDFADLYFNNNYSYTRNEVKGNPNLEPVISDQINMNILSRFYEIFNTGFDIRFSIDTYYKNYISTPDVDFIYASPDPYFQYQSYEKSDQYTYGINGNIDLSFNSLLNLRLNASTAKLCLKSNSNYLLDYTSDIIPGGNANVAFVSSKPYYMYGFSSTLSLDLKNIKQDFIPLPSLIRNIYLGVTGYFRSGSPYYRKTLDGRIIGDGSERQPDYFRLDGRASYTLNLGDVIPSYTGKTGIEFAVDIINLANNTSPTYYYPITGNADDNGVSLIRKSEDFTQAIYYKTGIYGNPESCASYQYDKYGKRLYNAAADLDGNGRVDPQERFTRYLQYIEDGIRLRENYMLPMRVYVSMMIRF